MPSRHKSFARGSAAFAVVIAIGSISGCAREPLDGIGPLPVLPSRDLSRDRAPEAGEDLGFPTGSLTLREALAVALLHSPRLRATAWEPRIAEARRLQAGLRPNPELGLGLEGFAGGGELGGTDSAETTVTLSQLVELGGKRQRRIDVAAAGRAVALAEYEVARLEVLTETALRYLRVLELQSRIALAERAEALAEDASRTVQRRVDAGDVSPIDATRSRLESDSAAILVDRLERQLRTARRELAAAWDQDEPTFGELVGELQPVSEVPALPQLLERLGGHPSLQRADAEVARLRAVADLERSRAVPDVRLELGAQYQGEAEEAGLVAGVVVPLPMFDRNQGNILAARLEAAQAADTIRVARRDLAVRLARAHGELEVAYHEARAVETQLLPAATEAFEATQRAYQEGKVAYLAVLEAQQTLFEIESRQVGAVSDYHRALAEVEGLVAAPLADRSPTGGAPDHPAPQSTSNPAPDSNSLPEGPRP